MPQKIVSDFVLEDQMFLNHPILTLIDWMVLVLVV
jgi:hypothetical protein